MGPEILTAVMAGASMLAAAGSAYATYSKGQADQSASEYNAQTAELQASQVREQAKVQAEAEDLQARRDQATARAQYGGSGVSQNEGSPLLVLMENARLAQHRQQEIEYGGELQAAGLQSQANVARTQGKNAATAGKFGAGVSLLGSAARIGTSYYGKPTSASKYGTAYSELP